MSQQSVGQAPRRSALDAQAVLRKERAARGRRLEALAVAVLTAPGERDTLARDAERLAAQELLLRRLAPIAVSVAVDDLWGTVPFCQWQCAGRAAVASAGRGRGPITYPLPAESEV